MSRVAPRVRRLTRLSALALGLSLLAAPVFAQAQYSLTDVGLLPGCTSATGTGVNEQGDVVGACLAGTNWRAFVYRGGNLSAVGLLPRGTSSTAAAINSAGTITGYGNNDKTELTAWVTTPSGLYNFFSNNGGYTITMSISDTGVIGGNYTTSRSGNVKNRKGAIWTPDPRDARKYRKFDLPSIPGLDPASTFSRPAAFNQGMQAAGLFANDVLGQRAAFWDNDPAHTIIDLGTLPDDWFSEARGLNDLGQVVGGSVGLGTRATLWNNDAARTPIELPLIAGDNVGWGNAVNNAGVVVGDSHFDAVNPNVGIVSPVRAVIWRNGMVAAVNDLLDPAVAAQYSVTEVFGINGQGQIVGTALRNGVSRAVLLTPVP